MSRGALVVVLAVSLGACGLGDKQAQSDRIVHAGEQLMATPSLRAVFEARVTIVKSDKPLAPGPPKLSPGLVRDLAAVIKPSAASAEIGNAVVFANDAIYQRIARKTISTGDIAKQLGAPSNFSALASAQVPGAAVPVATTTTTPSSKLRRRVQIVREWAAFDFAAIDDDDKTKHAGSFAINPVDLLRLTEGTLTGSIKRRGTVAGLTRYDANVSRDKAERHLSEDARQVLDNEFRANAVGRRVFPASFWLDGGGAIRRLRITLRQQLTKADRADLRVTFDSIAPADVSAAAAIKAPGRRGTVNVRTLGELVTTVSGA